MLVPSAPSVVDSSAKSSSSALTALMAEYV